MARTFLCPVIYREKQTKEVEEQKVCPASLKFTARQHNKTRLKMCIRNRDLPDANLKVFFFTFLSINLFTKKFLSSYKSWLNAQCLWAIHMTWTFMAQELSQITSEYWDGQVQSYDIIVIIFRGKWLWHFKAVDGGRKGDKKVRRALRLQKTDYAESHWGTHSHSIREERRLINRAPPPADLWVWAGFCCVTWNVLSFPGQMLQAKQLFY